MDELKELIGVECPYCFNDTDISIENIKQDLVNGGIDVEYYCEECGSTFYKSELEVEED